MYFNIYQQNGSIEQTLPKAGGLCGVTLFKKEDVLTWPTVNPQTGILNTAVQLKAGGVFYSFAASEKERTFKEALKYGPEGPFMDIGVTLRLPGNSAANIISFDAMKYHQWGIIVHDRDGNKRLVGNRDSCAKIVFDYTSEDIEGSRGRAVQFIWQHSNNAPIYEAAAFLLTIGGSTVVAGSLTLIVRFRVGDPGAPMNDGDDEYTNAVLADKKVLVLADGTGLPCDDGSGAIDWTGLLNRHIKKLDASDTITFVGDVVNQEIIEIYAWN